MSLNRLYLSCFVCLGGLLSLAALRAESLGAPEASAGAPGEEDCSACHGSNAGSGKVTLELEGGATSYTPGQKTRVKVTIDDSAARRWGFQATARPQANARTSAGAFATADAQTRILRSGVLEWITHTNAGTRRGTAGPVIFEFDWTAPSSDVGTVAFYVAANAANNDGSSSGDRIYKATVNLSAGAGGGARPAFTSQGVTNLNGVPGLAPNGWAVITGTDLASVERSASPVFGRALDTTLGGVQVKVNDVAAVLQSVSPARITFLVPPATPAGDVNVVVERDGSAGPPVVVRSSATLPAIYAVPRPDSDQQFASVISASTNLGLFFIGQRGWVLGKPDVDARASRGVAPGEEIVFYASGLGAVNGNPPAGNSFNESFPLATAPKVRFGQVTVDPVSAALVGPGLYAVRVKVPDSTGEGDVSFAIEAGGLSSSDKVFLNIQNP